MDYLDLKKVDFENAFIGWESVRNAKEVGDIPKQFHEYFTDRCECSSENIIKMNLRTVTCCDPKCPIKNGFALAEMFTRFGIKGLQEASCSAIYEELLQEDKRHRKDGKDGILISDSYVAVLGVGWDDYPSSLKMTAKGIDFFTACCRIVEKKMTFPKMVSMLAIPTLGAEAETLLRGIANVNQLLDLIEAEGTVKSFCNSRGFHSEMTAFYFRNSMVDITTANMLLGKTLRPEGGVKISVCMTGAITFKGCKTTKEKYLQECNDLCYVDGVQVMEVRMNAAIESNPFILYARASSDRKFVAGKARGIVIDDFGEHPVLMHVDLFYLFLERVMQEWKEATKLGQQEHFLLTLKTHLSEAMHGVLSETEA